jgi:hypothetical protein
VEKFTAGAVDTGGKFIADITAVKVKDIPLPRSSIPAVHLEKRISSAK